ncbi:unnamed protein product [Orchesella dallaii]|uniref:Serine/threonine-protein kinase 40 n=1 Tax=Orchesella dallaii TaxID=48710 RepID=A0ABP1S234_9HEXA
MQYYVIKEKKLPEAEAIRIFYKVVQIVERLHKLNIVHRDLKLGNIILNKDTGEVTLANFCLGKHLTSDNDLLKDQRGSPAYISPDVIIGKPYLGKPSDMWALGVVLYTMLYGQFPFYDQSPTELFRKIKTGEFQTPVDINVSKKTVELIQSLLVLDPKKRLTASQVLKDVREIIRAEESLMSDSDLQVVPDSHPGAERPRKRTYADRSNGISDAAFADIAALLAKSTCETESLESDDFEPYRKMAKRIVASPTVQIPGIPTHITLDELQRIHAMYVARKLKEAASLGKIAATLVPEVVTSHLTSSSSNGFTKSDATNLDSARVPDSYEPTCNNVRALSPTVAFGLDTRAALLGNDRALPTQ